MLFSFWTNYFHFVSCQLSVIKEYRWPTSFFHSVRKRGTDTLVCFSLETLFGGVCVYRQQKEKVVVKMKKKWTLYKCIESWLSCVFSFSVPRERAKIATCCFRYSFRFYVLCILRCKPVAPADLPLFFFVVHCLMLTTLMLVYSQIM